MRMFDLNIGNGRTFLIGSGREFQVFGPRYAKICCVRDVRWKSSGSRSLPLVLYLRLENILNLFRCLNISIAVRNILTSVNFNIFSWRKTMFV